MTIQQYEEEDIKAQSEFKEMSDKIKELEDKLSAYERYPSMQVTGPTKALAATLNDSEHSFGYQ